MKVYEVWMACVWDPCDSGPNDYEVLGVFTDKTAAIKETLNAVTKYLEYLVEKKEIDQNELNIWNDPSNVADVTSKLDKGEEIEIMYSGYLWGDQQFIYIVEEELNKGFSILKQRKEA